MEHVYATAIFWTQPDRGSRADESWRAPGGHDVVEDYVLRASL